VSISEIPIAYIISGIIGLLLIYIYKKTQTKIGEIRSYELLIFLFFISSLIIYGGQVYFKDVEVLIKLFAYLGFAMIFAFLNLFNVGVRGPGELALALLSPQIELLGKGDLSIGKIKVELKLLVENLCSN
jgi:hypothetical protein